MGDTGKLFLEFLASRRSDLLRIARNTRGEYSETDLHGVAWEMLALIRRRQGRPINLSCKEDQELILRWVYSEVVHFDETHIRKAVRLDQDWDGENSESSESRLAMLLDSDVSIDQVGLIDSEERQLELLETVKYSYSQFSAYLILLDRFKWDMLEIAEHLKLAATTLLRRMLTSQQHVKWQPSLFDRIQTIERDFVATVARRGIRVQILEGGAQQLEWDFA